MINTGFSEINEDRLHYSGDDPWYMEVAITGKCNFSCKYCNRFSSDVNIDELEKWLESVPQLHHIQITGGEPTTHPEFKRIVSILRKHTKVLGLSTNGSASIGLYMDIPIDMFSLSFDDCDYGILSRRGYKNPAHVEWVIIQLAKVRYVNVGLVIDELNVDRIQFIIDYILAMGVNDIKLSVSSHALSVMPKFQDSYAGYPILSYRVKNFNMGKPMRGFPTAHCGIMKNDITIVGDSHYPCLVYFREHGKPIGKIGKEMLNERKAWCEGNDCTTNPICSKFCMDFKCDFNAALQEKKI